MKKMKIYIKTSVQSYFNGTDYDLDLRLDDEDENSSVNNNNQKNSNSNKNNYNNDDDISDIHSQHYNDEEKNSQLSFKNKKNNYYYNNNNNNVSSRGVSRGEVFRRDSLNSVVSKVSNGYWQSTLGFIFYFLFSYIIIKLLFIICPYFIIIIVHELYNCLFLNLNVLIFLLVQSLFLLLF
jgi:hypothetical protein